MDHHPFHCYDQCGATNNDGNNDDYEGDSKEANADDNSSGDYDDASRLCIFSRHLLWTTAALFLQYEYLVTLRHCPMSKDHFKKLNFEFALKSQYVATSLLTVSVNWEEQAFVPLSQF